MVTQSDWDIQSLKPRSLLRKWVGQGTFAKRVGPKSLILASLCGPWVLHLHRLPSGLLQVDHSSDFEKPVSLTNQLPQGVPLDSRGSLRLSRNICAQRGLSLANESGVVTFSVPSFYPGHPWSPVSLSALQIPGPMSLGGGEEDVTAAGGKGNAIELSAA